MPPAKAAEANPTTRPFTHSRQAERWASQTVDSDITTNGHLLSTLQAIASNAPRNPHPGTNTMSGAKLESTPANLEANSLRFNSAPLPSGLIVRI
ncbi:MAG: hypothetical protein NTZ94_16390 [Verrucomicrobia bacterium]|nr:hypothetical protein [Verrucomicrobiota bacterium]